MFHTLSRRRFVQGLAMGGAAATLGLWPRRVAASDGFGAGAVLDGTEFDLQIAEAAINITGAPRTALMLNGSVPAPTLRWREGDTVTARVANTLTENTSVHWHGILLPANQDGVPGLSFNGIGPGETHTYRFDVRQGGTYWYHSHTGFQEQRGVYGALVIDPREPEPFSYDRDHVVMLSDWTDEAPEQLYRKLKKQADYYNYSQPTLGDFFRDVGARGLGGAVSERAAWGQMRMNRTDLADVTGATYTYLTNGHPPAANWTGLFAAGERVRLRFINAGAMTYFDVRIPGLAMRVVAADGQYVHPVTVDEFRLASGETIDVIVEPSGQDAYAICAQSMDRTAFAAGTLAVRDGLRAPMPDLDPRPLLSMSDMGHGHDMMDGTDHDMAMSMPDRETEAAAHAGHGAAEPAPVDPHAGHVAPDPHGDHVAPDPHSGHGAPVPAGGDASHAMPPPASMPPMLVHPDSERGNPLVDMQTMTPSAKLDDPGIGLRDNGRRVLTYADLKTLFPDPDGRDPGREIELHLTGHMERFVWSLDGVKYSDAEPIRLTYGERMRVVLVNDTMMGHPMHLHGLWSDLEDDQGQFHLRKHVIDMPPGTRRSFRVRADALGRWAFHCHLIYHMAAGMFREVRVDV
jgi:CopA family copper-resistance protein